MLHFACERVQFNSLFTLMNAISNLSDKFYEMDDKQASFITQSSQGGKKQQLKLTKS